MTKVIILRSDLKRTVCSYKYIGRILSLILLLGLIFGCGQSDKNSFQGYVEGENVYLASPYAGNLINLAVHRGQSVAAGEFLFQLDPKPEILQVNQAENDLIQAEHVLQDLLNPRRTPEIEAIKAQIEQTNAKLELAALRVTRNQTLYKKNAIDKDTVDASLAELKLEQKIKDQLQANLDLAEMGGREEQILAQKAQIVSLKEKLAESSWRLAQKTVKAPAAGLIFDTYYRKGEYVTSQQPVVSLLTPDNVRIEFFVPVQTLARLAVGNKVHIQCEGCRDMDEATIAYISPEAQYIPPLVYSRENDDKLVFRIKASLHSFNQYKPGQPVMVYIGAL